MRHRKLYPALMGFAALLFLTGLLCGDAGSIPAGLLTILRNEDALITDYIQLAGVGAALTNAAIVCALSVGLLWLCREPVNGYTPVVAGLMTGVALFGKNFLNIWPIIAGTFLYAKWRREPFARYAAAALLATALAPVVSFVALGGHWLSPAAGVLAGLGLGFVLPPLSGYTFRIQNGMNLYNMGFACGLVALVLVPVMRGLGVSPGAAHHWSGGNNGLFTPMVAVACAALILGGLFRAGRPAREAWAGYRRLLRTSGRAPSDYLRQFGVAPVLINTGVNGLIALGYVLAVGGDLNGPTLGGILTIMGFSAFGKHARNILPVMGGVLLGGLLMEGGAGSPSLQLAALFGTTLAPLSGCFGAPAGVLAGFLHASVVLFTAPSVAGLNLYNNGFSGGLIAIVLYPVLTAVLQRRGPVLQDRDYFDLFEEDAPQAPPGE